MNAALVPASATADFRSDAKTRPTQRMRDAIVRAAVGDEQAQEDPTANLLCERVAALLGKESAILMVSGTMCNTVAITLHCRPGDEMICARTAHHLDGEAGAPAAIAGVQMRPLEGARGMFTAEQVRDALRLATKNYVPETALLSVEQTTNLGGGRRVAT